MFSIIGHQLKLAKIDGLLVCLRVLLVLCTRMGPPHCGIIVPFGFRLHARISYAKTYVALTFVMLESLMSFTPGGNSFTMATMA